MPYNRHACTTSVVAFLLILAGTEVIAQKEFDGLRGTHKWMRFTDAPNALYHHVAGQAIERLEKRAGDVSGLKTLDEWKARQKWIRATLMEIAGPFPEKTPLNARITNVIKKDGFTVENIVYESQPGFYVTASLFVPSGLKRREKAPAIIYCSGHTELGYRADGYQNVILNLVMKGFVVFAIDPIGQGERLQFYNEETGESNFEWPSYEHSYAGAPLFIAGSSLGKYMIWDGIRAVDYLTTRKEVDAERIGITGRSGGGTQTALIAAFDERIKAITPGNYFTNFSWLLQSMGPQCAEQEFFSAISRGLDMADLLLVRAPKPAMIVATTRDMFPIQGSIETAEEVSRLYDAYGKADHFRMVTDDAAHASTVKNREAIYAFFQKHLNNPGDSTERVIKSLTKDELQVTETGQLSTSLKGETVFSLNLKEAQTLNDRLDERRKTPEHFSKVVIAAKELSGYREPKATEKPVFTGQIQRDGYTIRKYFVQGEGDYVIPYLLIEPEKPADKALIYLHPEGKVADSDEGGDMEWFVKNGFTVLAPDMIGTGEMGPGVFKGDSYIDSVSYNVWFTSILMGRSIVGLRAGDVVRLANLLKAQYDIKEIYGLAKAEMAPVLLHAAAFDEDIAHVALIKPYSSYRSLVTSRYYKPQFIHGSVHGSIGVYDLPDLAATVAPGKLLISGVTDGTGENTDSKIIDADISVIKSAYQEQNASDQLRIVSEASKKQLYNVYKEWINE